MRKLIAFLLIFVLLLGMTGTVSVAADEATIPAFTAIIANDGTVTVRLDDGVEDYQYAHASFYKKEVDGNYTWGETDLEYDSSQKAYIGRDETATGGKYVFSYIELEKSSYKENGKGTDETMNDLEFKAKYEDGKLSEVQYNTFSLKRELNEDEDVWFVTDASYEKLKNTYHSRTAKLSEVYRESGKTTGDKSETTEKNSSEKKEYEEYQGIYTGKTVTESESKSVYSKTHKEFFLESEKTTTKIYNEDDVLTGSGEGIGKSTFNKNEDEKTYENNYTSKEYSSRGYLNYTVKGISTEEAEWSEENGWKNTKATDKRTTTNRNGDVTYTYDSATEYGKEYAYTTKITDKNYNAYTGKVTIQTVTETESFKNTKEDQWETKETATKTYNNDDGTQRRKIETEKLDFTTVAETHYDSNGKVAAKMTYDSETNIKTWMDGSGKVLGKNEYDDKTGKLVSYISDPSFKDRTGELDSWYTEEISVNEKGVATTTTTYYDEGKKNYTNETIQEEDGSYKKYQKGVLRETYNQKDSEYKYYDIKGALSSSNKPDEDGNRRYYNYEGKMIGKDAYDEEEEAYIFTNYDPATGKVKSSSKYYNKDNIRTYEYRDANDKILYSEKAFYDKDLKANVTAYYDANDREFARTYSKTKDGVKTSQQKYHERSTWDPENASAQIEKSVSETAKNYRQTVETTNYTKWTVSSGGEKDIRTRKDQTITTWDNDQRDVRTYVGGTLTKHTHTEKNDYDGDAKVTTKYFDWYSGKETATDKIIRSDVPNDPMTYYKYYDAAGNLQYYSEVDNTDKWNWNHTYYAGGTLSRESWYDGLDGDSGYQADYYPDGSLSNEDIWTGHGKNKNGRYAAYNKDGSYRYWTDTVDGVSNSWVYNSKGQLQKYRWNEKTDDNGVHSYEIWDAAGTLLYTYTDYVNENGAPLADGTTETKTDAAGNKWAMKSVDGETKVELTLKNKADGWQYAVGDWFYVEKGEPVTESWRQIDGSWYYFDETGAMFKGIIAIYDDDTEKYSTYAANNNGTVTSGWTGWKNYNGDQNWTYTNANGEVLTGWQNIGGRWYYFSDGWYQTTGETYYKEDVEWKQSGWRGVMATGATKVWNSDWSKKHTYFFNEDGTWDNSPGWKAATVEVGTRDQDGEIESIYGTEYHYYDRKGNEVTGWQLIDGDWYYFNEDGVMINGWVKSGPKWYYLDPQLGGAMANSGWAEDVYEGWYYMDRNGQYQTGWLNDGGIWYYLKQDGAMASNEWAKSGSNWYYMGADGALATGWVKDHGSWYYLKQDGAMKTGWEGEGSTWYYLGEDGAMAADTDVTVDGKTYHFDANGLCTNP